MPEGFSISLLDGPSGGITVEWDLEALAALAEASPDATPQRPWSLASGPPDWDQFESLRIVSTAFADGQMVALAALRPAGAEGHGDDVVDGVIVRDGEPVAFEEVLLSTQYGAGGEIARINIEAYEGPDSVPVRVAGDHLASSSGGDELELEVNLLATRMDGRTGFGTLDVMRPA